MKPADLLDWDNTNTNILIPNPGLVNIGWAPLQKPTSTNFNWITQNQYQWLDYFDQKVQNIQPLIIRSANPVRWSGTDLLFSANILICFDNIYNNNSSFINQIAFASSPIALANGEVLVVNRNYAGVSPITLVAAPYPPAIGQYSITLESNLTTANEQNEMILFRRRGTNLEIPWIGSVQQAGAVFYLGSSGDPGGAVPIGSIIPFYDFNGALVFNPDNYVYCDGSVISNIFSPVNGETLPDLSGRYLVGFGIDGGANIGTAPWATAAVGNAGNTINIQHSHVVDPHTHSVPGLSFSQGAGVTGGTAPGTNTQGTHTHGPGTLQFLIAQANSVAGAPDSFNMFDVSGSALQVLNDSVIAGSAFALPLPSPSVARGDGAFPIGTATNNLYTSTGSGVTASDGAHSHTVDSHTHTVPAVSGTTGTGVTGSDSPGTNNALSTTQSIQPISIRVRFIMRVA